VLWGAVIAAYLPSLLAGARRPGGGPGWRFALALDVLRALAAARATPRRGLVVEELCRQLRVDNLQLEPVLEALVALAWAGRNSEGEDEANARYVLLADVNTTAVAPLVQRLLLPRSEATERFWSSGYWSSTLVKDVL